MTGELSTFVDGRLLVVSMTDRKLLRLDPGGLVEHADLSSLASSHCNDMVVDAVGRAYVGNFGFDLDAQADFKTAELVMAGPDGATRVFADELGFPNGTVITPDGGTLIVGESFSAASPEETRAQASVRIELTEVEVPGAGLP